MTMEGMERKISRFEGIAVRIRHANGRDVGSDKIVSLRYSFERRAADSTSVSSWLRTRFDPIGER